MNGAPKNSARLYLTNAFSSVATRVLQLTVLVWVNQQLLRRIEPAEYALLPIVMSLVLFADVIKNVFTGGLARYLVEADARGDDESMGRIVSSMLPILVGVAGTFAIGGALAAWQIDALVKVKPSHIAEARIMLLLLIGTMCFTVVASPLINGLYIRQQFTKMNVVDLGCEALRVAILLVLILGVSARVMWLVVATTVSTLVGSGIRILLTRRMLPSIRFRRELISFQTARTLLSFGAWTSVQGVSTLVESSAPPLLLNRFSTALDVACFHLGSLPDVQYRRVAMAATMPAQPALTSVYATGGVEALKSLYFRGGRYHLWLMLIIVPPLVVFGKPIIHLYVGDRFAITPLVMAALFIRYPFMFAAAMFYRISHAVGDVRRYYLSELFVRAASLAAMYYAVAHVKAGAVGMAVAATITTSILQIVMVWPLGLEQVSGRWSTFFRETLIPGMLPCLVAIPIGYLFDELVDVDSWLLVGLGTLIGCSVYVAVLVSFCLDTYDRDLLSRIVNRTRSKLGRYALPFR